MGQDVQHRAAQASSRSGSQAFSESLEDFAAHDSSLAAGAEPVADEDAADESPAPEPVVTLHPDELERLKQEAWQQGHEQGEMSAGQQLSSQMAASVKQVLAFMEEEENRRHDIVSRMADLFVQGVCQTVEELVAGDLSRTTLGRDLAEDAAALVRHCSGPVSLTCAAADEASLRHALSGMAAVSLHVEAAQQAGHLTIAADRTRIVLDQGKWAETVRQRVADAMVALTRPPAPEADPATDQPQGEQTAQHEGE
ncbi:hypothetical protein GM608_06865 [Bombella sp. ESL0380]|uniref:hypothetical protein n=1 Tax=Bombella sp. ESL0380 TaxID=2676444 RepID=UPI0013272D79|nr:hypothetical protein [Bombella sp. ESL0380]MUH03295.1 hypothetical protein [Bombella sp. ESL0387]